MTEIDIKPDTAPTLEPKKNETFDEERALAVAKRIGAVSLRIQVYQR